MYQELDSKVNLYFLWALYEPLDVISESIGHGAYKNLLNYNVRGGQYMI